MNNSNVLYKKAIDSFNIGSGIYKQIGNIQNIRSKSRDKIVGKSVAYKNFKFEIKRNDK